MGRAWSKKRLLLAVAVVAVAISIPAGTASGGSIAVNASLGGCEPGGGGVVCNLKASFTEVGGADYYTASVTGPDGARQDLGTVPAGSASLWPRYTADGVYTVTITAWDDGRRVKRGVASAGG
jgi:hypothetical protein